MKGRIVASLDNVFHAEHLADILSNRQGIGPGECHGVISPGLRHSISREHSTQMHRLIGKKVLQLLPLFVAGADQYLAERIADGRSEAAVIVGEATSDAQRIAEQLRVQAAIDAERIRAQGDQHGAL